MMRVDDAPDSTVTASRTSIESEPLVRITPGFGPVIAFALHAGHALRADLDDYIALSDADRLREEDPFTASMVPDGLPVVEAVRSRFEVDLNRPRERAVYRDSDDAWGMELYRRPLSAEAHAASLAAYDEFYDSAHRVLRQVEREHGRFVVLDLHSYNHRRAGRLAEPAPVEGNPEVNLGTGRIDRDRWRDVVEEFVSSMSESGLDCRENVRFRGGHFSQWVSDMFPESGVALAIEFKKTYMDEWTGCADPVALERIRRALADVTTCTQRILSEMT